MQPYDKQVHDHIACCESAINTSFQHYSEEFNNFRKKTVCTELWYLITKIKPATVVAI